MRLIHSQDHLDNMARQGTPVREIEIAAWEAQMLRGHGIEVREVATEDAHKTRYYIGETPATVALLYPLMKEFASSPKRRGTTLPLGAN